MYRQAYIGATIFFAWRLFFVARRKLGEREERLQLANPLQLRALSRSVGLQ